MKLLKTLALGTTLLLSSGWIAAQSWPAQNTRFDSAKREDGAAFQTGFQHGLDDAKDGRSRHAESGYLYRESDDRQAFNEGYNRGYNSIQARSGDDGRDDRAQYQDRDHDHDWDRDHDRDRDRDRDHDWDRNRDRDHERGNDPRQAGYQNQSRAAQQFGYRDGMNDGRGDHQTGHSFRPTHDPNYKAAANGWSSGDRDQYKAAYRQAYEQGYQQGYYGKR